MSFQILYFQRTCIQIIIMDNKSEISVFGLIPSLKYTLTNIPYTIIPIPNPIKRDGHNNPSLPSTVYFVAMIKRYEMGIPKSEIINGFFLKNSHMNCPCIWNHVVPWASKKNSIPINMFFMGLSIYVLRWGGVG